MKTNAIHEAKTPFFRGRTESVTRGGHVYLSSRQGLTDYRGRSFVDRIAKSDGISRQFERDRCHGGRGGSLYTKKYYPLVIRRHRIRRPPTHSASRAISSSVSPPGRWIAAVAARPLVMSRAITSISPLAATPQRTWTGDPFGKLPRQPLDPALADGDARVGLVRLALQDLDAHPRLVVARRCSRRGWRRRAAACSSGSGCR